MNKKVNLCFTNFFPIGSRTLQVIILIIIFRVSISWSNVKLTIFAINPQQFMEADLTFHSEKPIFGKLISQIDKNKLFVSFSFLTKTQVKKLINS